MHGSSLQKKSVFIKIEQIFYPYKNALWALRHAKPLGVLSRHPCRNPKPLPHGEGLCMLSWLCIVQSIWAYTPGVRAGLSVGLPPSPRLGLRPKPHFQKLYRFIDRLKRRNYPPPYYLSEISDTVMSALQL